MAGRICYKSFGVGLNPNVTKIRESSRDYIDNTLSKGDGSIFEHATCTFAFLNVSRVFTHELVRHRVGVAISQESLRYVRPTQLRFWLPPELQDKKKEVKAAVEQIEQNYRDLEKSYGWDKMNFDVKKRITSALRRIMPDGMATSIVWSANHRTIRHVITMRTAESAEVEIQVRVRQGRQDDEGAVPSDLPGLRVHRAGRQDEKLAPEVQQGLSAGGGISTRGGSLAARPFPTRFEPT